MTFDGDEDECRGCYHDKSWHNDACEACVDEGVPAAELCEEFVE